MSQTVVALYKRRGMGSHKRSCRGKNAGYSRLEELNIEEDLTMDEAYSSLLDAHTLGSHHSPNIQSMASILIYLLCNG